MDSERVEESEKCAKERLDVYQSRIRKSKHLEKTGYSRLAQDNYKNYLFPSSLDILNQCEQHAAFSGPKLHIRGQSAASLCINEKRRKDIYNIYVHTLGFTELNPSLPVIIPVIS